MTLTGNAETPRALSTDKNLQMLSSLMTTSFAVAGSTLIRMYQCGRGTESPSERTSARVSYQHHPPHGSSPICPVWIDRM